MAPPPFTRGRRVVQRLLAERCCDVRDVDLARFRDWLAVQLTRWRRDPVFLHRVGIRELRRSQPALLDLERRWRRAARADAGSPSFAELAARERQVANLGKALSGLAGARAAASGERRSELGRKLEDFRLRHRRAEAELAELVRASPERQELLRLAAELRDLRHACGLEAQEERLRDLLRGRGRHSGRSGRSFETWAAELTREVVARDLVRGDAQPLHVLVGVTLGAAQTELDQLVVRAGPPVEVVALVEVKRSLDDLAHGFRRRQENLAWLTGGLCDPSLWRNRSFPDGRFDRSAVHRQDGQEFVLTPDSFRRFAADPATGHFLRRLYFVTRPGRLRGLSSAALARVSARVATDVQWDPDDEAYLARLLAWCRTLAHPLESPDVLRLYASRPSLARQVLLLGHTGLAGNSQRS